MPDRASTTNSSPQHLNPAAPTENPTNPSTGSLSQILPAVFFTFVCYLTIGLPLAILPTFVHLSLGFGTVIAGLVISAQYIATVISRPQAGRLTDRLGPQRTVIIGLTACAFSGFGTLAAAFFTNSPRLCLLLLLLGRLMLGIGESLVSIGGIIWGVGRAGSHNIAKVISWNGVATYSALAIGAPLGIVLEQHGRLPAVSLVIILSGLAGVALAMRLAPIPVIPPKPLPFAHIFWRVAPHGTALALGGIGFGVIATFITLFYARMHWSGAALSLTLYGVCFIGVRLTCSRFINRFGGFPVALVSLVVEIAGLTLLAFAHARATAFIACALIGFGFSLIFPSLGVEAVRHIPIENRGTAIGAYNVFVDFSLFITGPIAGAIIARRGYPAAFLSAAAAVVLAFILTAILTYRERSLPISS